MPDLCRSHVPGIVRKLPGVAERCPAQERIASDLRAPLEREVGPTDVARRAVPPTQAPLHSARLQLRIQLPRHTADQADPLTRDLGTTQPIDELISRIDVDGLERLASDGKLSEGMIPKIRSCIDALRNGVSRAHILDGRIPHALLLEFFTREGIGTMIGPA